MRTQSIQCLVLSGVIAATLSGCGPATMTSARTATFTVPVSAAPTYLGPVAKSYVAWDGSHVDPPPAGARPRLDFATVVHERCSFGGNQCRGPHFRMTVALGSVTEMNGSSGPGADHRLMYVVDEIGMQCRLILTGGPQIMSTSAGPRPWPEWCRGIGFIDANGADLPRWGGVGPMPGQSQETR